MSILVYLVFCEFSDVYAAMNSGVSCVWQRYSSSDPYVRNHNNKAVPIQIGTLLTKPSLYIQGRFLQTRLNTYSNYTDGSITAVPILIGTALRSRPYAHRTYTDGSYLSVTIIIGTARMEPSIYLQKLYRWFLCSRPHSYRDGSYKAVRIPLGSTLTVLPQPSRNLYGRLYRNRQFFHTQHSHGLSNRLPSIL